MDTIYMVQADITSGGALIATLGLLVALAAVIVGPLVQNLIARKQTLLPMRQQWIENLRNALVDYVTTTHVFYMKGRLDKEKAKQDLFDTLHTLMAARYRVELMINPEEDPNVKLLNQMRRVEAEIYKPARTNDADFIALLQDIVSAAQNVLKIEWDVIRNWT
jgi:hypothetical protein